MGAYMIKKTHIVFLSFLCAALGGCGSSRPLAEKETSPLTVVTATDLHYLSPELTDYGTGFMRMVGNGDGKLTQYAPEITDAFLEEVEKLHPDALILSGDLSFNGEKTSHEELAGKLLDAVGVRPSMAGADALGRALTEAAPEQWKELTERAHAYAVDEALANTDRRIKILYGDAYGVSLHSQLGEGTAVVVTIPKQGGSLPH